MTVCTSSGYTGYPLLVVLVGIWGDPQHPFLKEQFWGVEGTLLGVLTSDNYIHAFIQL